VVEFVAFPEIEEKIPLSLCSFLHSRKLIETEESCGSRMQVFSDAPPCDGNLNSKLLTTPAKLLYRAVTVVQLSGWDSVGVRCHRKIAPF
jgi:hypothetical protein